MLVIVIDRLDCLDVLDITDEVQSIGADRRVCSPS